MSALDFLREVGKNFRVGTMMKKEIVAKRLNSEEGISYTEFSYQVLQGNDFLELHRRHGVSLQTGGSVPTQHAHPLIANLTDREREVLALIGEGSNNAEIAERLVVSPATARTHVSRVMIKLGARDRAQLVVIAYQSGLVC